jgi:hypothetical protein
MTAKHTPRGNMTKWVNPAVESRQLPVAEPPQALRRTLSMLEIGGSMAQLAVAPPAQLLARFKETDLISTKKRLPIQFCGYRPLFRGSLVYQARTSDWAIMNLADDPFFRDHGQWLYAPQHVVNDIQRFDWLGMSFDAIFIAHELPKGSVIPGKPVPFDLIAPPPPAAVQRRLSFLERNALAFWQSVARLAGVVAKAGAVATVGVAAAATLAVTAPVGLDPILFGVHFDESWQVNGRPIGLWYYLTHWYWSEEDQENRAIGHQKRNRWRLER